MKFASSKFISKPLWVAAHLGIADQLKNGPKGIEVLARETQTLAEPLYRVLRALASVGIFTEVEPRTFKLTPMAETLVSGTPESLRDGIIFQHHPIHDLAWAEILYSVQTGRPGFEKALGMPVFEYFQKNREFSEIFNRAMTSNVKRSTDAIVSSYDFSGIKKLVDVGGGHGGLMFGILERNPSLQGIVYDLPHVIEGTQKSVETHGMGSRCQARPGDFFESVPQGDAIIMSHIIHDWDDEKSVLILKNSAKVLPKEGKVLICEAIVPPGDEFSPVKLLDLEMLVMPGGKERTREEFEQLLQDAGLRLSRVVTTESHVCVIEGVPA